MGRKESACVKRRRNRAAGTQKGAAGQTGTGELSQFPRHPLLQGHTTSSWAQGSGESVSDKPQAPTPPTNEPLGGPIPVTHTCAHMCTVWSNLTHPLQPVSGPRGPRAHLLPSPASSSDPPTHHLPCGPSPAPTEPRPQTPASPHSRLSHLSRAVTQLNRTLAPWARRGASKQEEEPGEPATPGTKGPPGEAPSHRGQEVRVSVLVLWVCQKDLGKNPEELLIHR